MMKGTYTIVPYDPKHLQELVSMWRASFEHALGIVDPHPLSEQVEHFENDVLPTHAVRVALDRDGMIVGFLASTPATIAQLYVHVDHQRIGIGSLLLGIAKDESDGRLRLFTFASNTNAREFYRKHGFSEIAQGFEETWQLADVELEWMRDRTFPSPHVSTV